MFVGVFVYLKAKNLPGRVLVSLSSVFSIFVILNLISWLTSVVPQLLFFWSLFGLAISIIFILCAYLLFVFLFNRDVTVQIKYLFLVLLLPIISLTPTNFSITSFNGTYCVVNEGELFLYYYYLFGLISAVLSIFLLVKRNNQIKDKGEKRKNNLFTFGIECFILMIFFTSLIASYLYDTGFVDSYNLEPYGLYGPVIFMSILSFLIVRFKAFDIKLLGAQALVWALVILIGSQFFFIESDINRILVSITLIISAIVGLMIIRSVKKEVAQRGQIEQLAKSLESSNDKLANANFSLKDANERLKELDLMKSEFVSLATHQIRGPLAAIKGYISLMVEGDYGKVPAAFDEPLSTIFKSTDSLSRMVTDFLDVSRIDLGQMKYEFTEFDFRDLVKEVATELKPNIDARGLEFREKITDQACPIKADRTKLKQVLNNLVDNSSKYTKSGWLEISVEKKKDSKILFAVKDSGVGISEKTLSQLFQRFSRAKNANDSNILGTGLGLYIAKKMVEANSGKVWAESEGEGKGAQFYVEIPAVK